MSYPQYAPPHPVRPVSVTWAGVLLLLAAGCFLADTLAVLAMSAISGNDAPLQSLIAIAAMSVLFAAVTLVAGGMVLASAASGRGLAVVTAGALLFYRVSCMAVEATFLAPVDGMEMDAEQVAPMRLMAITTGLGIVLLAASLVMLLHTSSKRYYEMRIAAKQANMGIRPTALALATVLSFVFSCGWFMVAAIGLTAAFLPDVFPLFVGFPGGQLGLLAAMGPIAIVAVLIFVNALFLARDSVSGWRFSRVFNLLLLGGLVCITTAFLATLGMDRMVSEASGPGMPDWLLESGSVLLLVQLLGFGYTVYMLHSPAVDWYFRSLARQPQNPWQGAAPGR